MTAKRKNAKTQKRKNDKTQKRKIAFRSHFKMSCLWRFIYLFRNENRQLLTCPKSNCKWSKCENVFKKAAKPKASQNVVKKCENVKMKKCDL